MSVWCIVGECVNNKTQNDKKVFIKTFKHAEKIVKDNTHIDGQKIKKGIEAGLVDSSELGTCTLKNRYLGRNVYVTRSLNTCSQCVHGGDACCGECTNFRPLIAQPAIAVCPICGYRRCHLHRKTHEEWNYGQSDNNFRAIGNTKNANHYFCPKCWGIHNIVTRKIIRHKDGFMLPIVMNPKFQIPQDQYCSQYDPEKDEAS